MGTNSPPPVLKSLGAASSITSSGSDETVGWRNHSDEVFDESIVRMNLAYCIVKYNSIFMHIIRSHA
jgi:hypothetical protein